MEKSIAADYHDNKDHISAAHGLALEDYPMAEKDLRPYSALAFAYIGDSVFDLIIKTHLVSRGYNRPNYYHSRAIHYVSASAQTRIMKAIRPLLNEEELNIFRRGRNSRMISPAKNQSPHDYRIATGFEALIGWLYLLGKQERIRELVAAGVTYIESQVSDRDSEKEKDNS